MNQASDPLVSDEALWTFQFVCYGIVLQTIDVFGTMTNIINIICFVKQGLKDPINVSLLGLAISDLGSLVTLIFTNICFFPPFQELDLPFDPIDFQHLVSTWPHVMFSRITSWITALITLERCLCIMMPLKVKNIINPKRTAVVIAGVFIFTIGGNCVQYYTNRLVMSFSPERNRTILQLHYTDDRATVEQFLYPFNNVLFPFTAFLFLITSMLILVTKLRQKSKWRQKCAALANADTYLRDQRVAKMVVVISTLFIACFIPLCVIFIIIISVPGFNYGGQYMNTIVILSAISFILESTNSASNIFIYYHMSSRYRATFRELFVRGEKK